MASPENRDLEIVRNDSVLRFEAKLDDAIAFLTYRRAPGRITLIHTEVPESLQGHGVAGRLAATALEFAKSRNLKVVLQCPFVTAYVERYPEYATLIDHR